MPLTSVTLSQSPLGLLWHPSGYSHTSIGNIPFLVELHNSKSKYKDGSRQRSHQCAIGVTLAIAFILLFSNFTIINVQQQLTTQPGQLFIIPQTDESTPLSESEEKVRY